MGGLQNARYSAGVLVLYGWGGELRDGVNICGRAAAFETRSGRRVAGGGHTGNPGYGSRAFNGGSTPEEILLEYDSLRLEDVYLVLGYYLRHRAEVEAYLAERRRRGDERQAEADARLPWAEVRARLLARQQGPTDAAPRDG